MTFLDMGFGEILLILIVALLIWGPGKLPEIARTLGKTMNNLKKMSFDLSAQVRKELETEEKKVKPSPGTDSSQTTEPRKAISDKNTDGETSGKNAV